MNEVKSTDFPGVYEDLGIDTGNLGCVMIATDPLVISDVIKEADYYYSDEHKWVNGNVSENVPHVTLLYGLMRSGPELKKHIEAVLGSWDYPDIEIDSVGFFYGHNGEYLTLIAFVKVTEGLAEGHQRLSLLPHINTFGTYKPHITLAYLKANADIENYVDLLNERFANTTVQAKGIDIGE